MAAEKVKAQEATGGPAPPAPSAGQTDRELWERLAAPFAPDWIEKLPKQVQKDDREKGKCVPGSKVSADGHYCGKYHARSVHLDYVGHAGITMRLNDVVGPAGWSLEPYAETADGLPLLQNGEFWVRLTILGVSKIEVATNYSGTQEALGDALRRAAMRFGVGTYLWSKSDAAHSLATQAEDAAPGEPPPTPPSRRRAEPPPPAQKAEAEERTERRRAVMREATKEGKWQLNAATWEEQVAHCQEEYGASFDALNDEQFGEFLRWISHGGLYPEGYKTLRQRREIAESIEEAMGPDDGPSDGPIDDLPF